MRRPASAASIWACGADAELPDIPSKFAIFIGVRNVHSAGLEFRSLGISEMCLELRGSFRCSGVEGPGRVQPGVAGRNPTCMRRGAPCGSAEVCCCCHWLAGESARWQTAPSRGTTARGGWSGSRDRDPTAGRNSGDPRRLQPARGVFAHVKGPFT